MILPQSSDQVFFGDMRISLGGCDGSMTEKLLYYANIHPIAQKQGRHRMRAYLLQGVDGF